jgi:hypothetical protein
MFASVAWPAICAAQSLPPNQEHLFEETNQIRAEHSLPPLQWDNALAAAAGAHAALVAQNGQLSHQYPGESDLAARVAQAGAHFQSVAENIAMGPDTTAILNEWMNSPPHRATILNPNLNAVGFAVVAQGENLYAVGDFENRVAQLTVDQVEQAVTKVLSAQGVQVNGPRLDARQTCEMSHGSAGGSTPRFVMRWQCVDLSVLPDALEQHIATHLYHTAAVGACSSANAERGFTSYRVAVLLY